MRLAFMGTPAFSVDILQGLINAGHDVAAVYSQPPSRSGRGKKHQPSPVQMLAESLGIPVHTPTSLRSETEIEKFANLKLEAAVVVAYGLILPAAILSAPEYGCLNIHASLLPRWRGAAPIQRAIMAGDKETGINIMVMTAGLDTGPVILERRLPILPSDTMASLQDKLQALGAATINPALAGFAAGELTARPQGEQGVTYAHKIDKKEAEIDWHRPAEDVRNHIHGLSPFPGAYSTTGNMRIKMLRAEVVENTGPTDHMTPGHVIASPLIIACGDGRAINILTAQRAGKGRVPAEALVHGLPMPPGTVFS